MSELYTPKIILPTEQGELGLTYFNSRIRTFKNPDLDHVEYYTPQRTLGLLVIKEVLETMFDHDWPSQYDPIIDESSLSWYTAAQAKNLDGEIDGLLPE